MKQLYQKSLFRCALLISAALLFSGAQLSAAIVVTVTTTSDAPVVPGYVTLRQAIVQTNASTTVNNQINFLIPKTDTGYDPATGTWTIQPLTDLPPITQQVTINGYSQPGSFCATPGSNAVLTIVLNGSNYTVGDGFVTGNGLYFAPMSNGAVDNSVVTGLVINQWLGNGILLDTTSGSITGIKILGNFIGTNASGTQQMANRTGIGLSGPEFGPKSTIIGTPAACDRNIIAGSFGFNLLNNPVGGFGGACIASALSSETSIQNNYIGTDVTGTKALGNSVLGINLSDVSDMVIGNLISGHITYGIRLLGSSQTVIQNNIIGTDISGTIALGNANAGIEIESTSPGNTIIGNLISGNGMGIRIGQLWDPGSTLNTVQNNLIGTDKNGNRAIPNTRYGIQINDSLNTIGGTEPGQANVISGNLQGGVLVYGNNSIGNIVSGNLIGTDSTGLYPLPNMGNGIQIGLNGGIGGTLENVIGASSSSLPALEKKPIDVRALKKAKTELTNIKRKKMESRRKQEGTATTSHESVHFPMHKMDKTFECTLAHPAQTIGLNFTSSTLSDTIIPLVSPMPSGWVGPQQYILASYGSIRSFDKTTGLPDGALDIDAFSFFGSAAANGYQPSIHYSRFLDRWIISIDNVFFSTDFIVAWSDSGIITPETVWTFATFSVTELGPEVAFIYERFVASDANAVYISLETFNAPPNYNEIGTSTIVIPNSAITTGNSSPAFTVFSGIADNSMNNTVPPAVNFDQDAQFGYLINAFDYSQLYFYRILNPGSAQPTLGQPITLNVPPYAEAALAPHKGNLYTSNNSTAMYIDTQSGPDRILTIPHVRNRQLYLCHMTQVNSMGQGTPSGDRAGIRWYQFDLTGDSTGNGCGIETETTCPVLVQWGTIYDSAAENPKFYYLPAIMTNKNGDLVVEGTVSGVNDYINVFYAGRKASDPLGFLRDPALITNTTNPYNYGPYYDQSWGDYSALAPDPSNDLIIWSTGEWAAVNNGWGFQATQLLPTK